jgi:hypothetical protein
MPDRPTAVTLPPYQPVPEAVVWIESDRRKRRRRRSWHVYLFGLGVTRPARRGREG